jgi:antitoxin HicB
MEKREQKMTPVEILKKPYARMILPEDNGQYFAEIVEFPGCFATGDSPQAALMSLEEVAADWIASSLSQGQSIPEPMDSAGYSGKLVLRMPKSLHRRAAIYASKDDVSLNQFIVSCLAEKVGSRTIPAQLSIHISKMVAITVGSTVRDAPPFAVKPVMKEWTASALPYNMEANNYA